MEPTVRLFGPMPVLFAKKLDALLMERGSNVRMLVSKEGVEVAIQQHKSLLPGQYPTYLGQADEIFVEIALSDLLIVRGELEKMGFVVRSEEPEELEHVAEYVCRKCEYVASTPGRCPKHDIALLEFSQCANSKTVRSDSAMKTILIVVAGLAVASIAYSVWDSATGGFIGRLNEKLKDQ